MRSSDVPDAEGPVRDPMRNARPSDRERQQPLQLLSFIAPRSPDPHASEATAPRSPAGTGASRGRRPSGSSRHPRHRTGSAARGTLRAVRARVRSRPCRPPPPQPAQDRDPDPPARRQVAVRVEQRDVERDRRHERDPHPLGDPRGDVGTGNRAWRVEEAVDRVLLGEFLDRGSPPSGQQQPADRVRGDARGDQHTGDRRTRTPETNPHPF